MPIAVRAGPKRPTWSSVWSNRGARDEHRSRGNPPPQFHPPVPVRDAGRAHLRHRRLRNDPPRSLGLADVKGFAARRQESEKNGKRRGLGYSCYIEACGLAPSNIAGALGARAGLFEVGQVRVHPTGSVTVFTGSHSHGQGHETTFAQVVADRLGIALDNVEIVHGDTGRIAFGMGTYGSRSIAVGGTAIMKALDKIEAKAKKIAAHLLEAAAEDIEFKDGMFRVAGTDRTKAFAEISLAAYVPHNYPLDMLEPGLTKTRSTIRPTSPIRPARISARSRSIRRRA